MSGWRLTIGEWPSGAEWPRRRFGFYEDKGLINPSARALATGATSAPSCVASRSSCSRSGVGLTLEEIGTELAAAARPRAPTRRDWSRLSSWSSRIDERIAELERLKVGLTECIGCGCLSLDRCQFANPGDRASRGGRAPAIGSATACSTEPPSPRASTRPAPASRAMRERGTALEAGLRALAHVLLDVRVEAESRQPGAVVERSIRSSGSAVRSTISSAASSPGCTTMAGGAQRALQLRAEQQVRAVERHAGHGG